MEQAEPFPRARRAVQKGIEVINIYDGPEVFLETFGQVPREIGLLYAAAFCQVEVCNGGFSQFFGNSAGVLAPEAVEGFVAIGQPQIAEIVREAMAQFGSPYPRERGIREDAFALLPKNSFDGLEQRFYALTHPREAVSARRQKGTPSAGDFEYCLYSSGSIGQRRRS